MGIGLVMGAVAVLVVIVFFKTAVVVPQQHAYVVERLGRYRTTLDAGFHILIPFGIYSRNFNIIFFHQNGSKNNSANTTKTIDTNAKFFISHN